MSEKCTFWVTLRPQSDCYRRGEAEVHIFDFKTSWSEFQKPSQTATEQGKADLHILNFKTTWSEFQKRCQTVVVQGKAELQILKYKINITSPESVPSSCVRQHT